MNAAESGVANEMFARSARERAFARCMGDDMGASAAGYADPFASSDPNIVVTDGNRKRRVKKEDAGDEVLWSEGG